MSGTGRIVRPTAARGFRDVLFEEAAERRVVTEAVLEVAGRWGYRRVETPVLERAETLGVGAGAALEGESFRLLDLDGDLLALRPEMTLPIARLAVSRLREEQGPKRISYAAPVFRERASYRGQFRQFTQLGVELIDAAGPAADAEVVAVMVECLRAAGVDGALVGVGTAGLLRELIGETDAPEEWRERVMLALHDRNLVGLDALVDAAELAPAVATALREVPRIRGRREAIGECRAVVDPCGCGAALDELEETWDLLEAAGVAGDVSVDFGLLRSFDYYTGVVLEAYTGALGLPLGGGGRYDGLLGAFGSPAPAAGFALGLERVHVALAEQGTAPEVAAVEAVLGGETGRELFAAARALRGEGRSVRLLPGACRDAVAREAERLGAARALWAAGGTVSLASGGE